MPLDLDKVDLSAVEKLAEIKAEQDCLTGRLATMTERRAQVTLEVWQRVHGDYTRRLDELRTDARPLRQCAGETYRELREELAKLEAAAETARLDREEVEFRHSLGEFDTAAMKEKLKLIEKRGKEHGDALERALALKAKFLAVVDEEADLDPGEEDTARMEAITDQMASATVAVAPMAMQAPEAVAMAPTRPSPVETSPDGATMVAAPIAAPAPEAAVSPPAPTAPKAVSRTSRNPDATVVFRQGRLEPANAEAGNVVQTLGLKPISIGSAANCDMQLSAEGVAKRHAEILMTRAGFCLRDVSAGGVVKVNGELVQEQRVLAEGDSLLIGSAQFNFRLL